MEADLKPLVQCRICKKVLKDPRHLPCLHTFCRTCINEDAKNRIHSEKSRTYYCPKCSRLTKFSSDVSIKHWGEQLPQNKLALNVVDGYLLKTGSSSCKPCQRKRKSTAATHWCTKCKEPLCDSCVDSHNSFKTTMGHEIVNISTMKDKPLKDILTPPACNEHQEDLDHYCNEHKQFICSTCKSNAHRSCKSVLQTSVYAQQMRDKSTKSLQLALGQHEKNSKTLLENRTNEKETLEVTKTKISEDILAVRQKITEMLTKYEKRCLKELDDIYQKEKQVLNTDIEGVQGIYNSSHNMNNFLKSASKHAHDVHFIEWQTKIEKEEQMLNDMIYDINEPLTSSKVSFKVNSDLEKVMKSVQSLGGFSINKEQLNLIQDLNKPEEKEVDTKQENYDNVSMLSLQLPSNQFSVRTRTDENACFITGMAMIPSNILVCADKNNSKIKTFNSSFEIEFEYEQEQPPFDVTYIGHSSVAFTTPSKTTITVLDVKSTGLTVKKKILTNDACYGLAYSNKRFAYTCPYAREVSVKMINDKGEQIMIICPEENFQSLFLRPWYVQFDKNGSHLYISDCNRAKIYCCVGSSLRRFAYSNKRLNAPRGLAVRKNDDFLVVGWGSDNVHFVDRNGSFIREVVNRWNGTFSPQALCLDVDENRMIISLDPTSCSSDTVLVFELSGDWF